jgi:cytochrome c-type biogenesis protein
MIDVTFAGALLAGLLSFLSPCVLPLVPAYLSYISGVSVDALQNDELPERRHTRRHVMAQSVWFVLGFSAIFIALGASASFLGAWLLVHMTMLAKVAGVVVMVFGLHYMGLIRIPFLLMEARLDTAKINPGHGFGAALLGAAFAFGWTPCVGPILGAILALASAQNGLGRGIALLTAYSAGLAIPFLLAAFATGAFLRWAKRFRRHLHKVEILSGILLFAVGLLIFFGSFSIIAGWIIRWFPGLAHLESAINP